MDSFLNIFLSVLELLLRDRVETNVTIIEAVVVIRKSISVSVSEGGLVVFDIIDGGGVTCFVLSVLRRITKDRVVGDRVRVEGDDDTTEKGGSTGSPDVRVALDDSIVGRRDSSQDVVAGLGGRFVQVQSILDIPHECCCGPRCRLPHNRPSNYEEEKRNGEGSVRLINEKREVRG